MESAGISNDKFSCPRFFIGPSEQSVSLRIVRSAFIGGPCRIRPMIYEYRITMIGEWTVLKTPWPSSAQINPSLSVCSTESVISVKEKKCLYFNFVSFLKRRDTLFEVGDVAEEVYERLFVTHKNESILSNVVLLYGDKAVESEARVLFVPRQPFRSEIENLDETGTK